MPPTVMTPPDAPAVLVESCPAAVLEPLAVAPPTTTWPGVAAEPGVPAEPGLLDAPPVVPPRSVAPGAPAVAPPAVVPAPVEPPAVTIWLEEGRPNSWTTAPPRTSVATKLSVMKTTATRSPMVQRSEDSPASTLPRGASQ